MAQIPNKTLEELEETRIVNQITSNLFNLIKRMFEASKLVVNDLCVHLDVDRTTYYRWNSQETCHIPTHKLISAFKFLNDYIKKEKIPIEENLANLIEEIEKVVADVDKFITLFYPD